MMDPLSGLVDFVVANWQWVTAILIPSAVAVYLYFKGKRKKLLCYALWSVNIIQDLTDKFRGLKITYSRKRFKNLTSTKIAFWNAGNETITSQDIAKANPIAIQVTKGCKIIATKILSVKNQANTITVTPTSDQTQAKIRFDYLDKDEGAVIQVLHTGLHTGQSNEDIDIHGNLKGVRELSRMNIMRTGSSGRALGGILSPARVRLISLISTAAVLIVLFALTILMAYSQEADIYKDTIWTSALISLIVVLQAYLLNKITGRLPKGFGEFDRP